MIRFIAGIEFTVLALSSCFMLLSIIRPDLRSWPPPTEPTLPRPVLAIVGRFLPIGLLGVLLLGALDWNSLALESWARALGGVLFAAGGFWALFGVPARWTSR